MDIINDLQDLRYLNWSKVRHSSGTAGTLLKAEELVKGNKYYYKLSMFEDGVGVVGHECVNEIIVDRLLTALNIEHLDYSLIHALIVFNNKEYETYLCKSRDFKHKGEAKTAFDAYYLSHRFPDESALDFAIRNGWSYYVYKMFVVDYLILNRDRHGANIEVLKNQDGEVRLAPLFDHGLSLLYDCNNPSALKKNDYLADKKVVNFIGTGYTLENLSLIPKDMMRELPQNKEEILDNIFKGMDNIISSELIKAIKRMISERWKFYEILRDKK